jgi:ElaB/YqjD/DUF883 family membrane-anchored ribosome-binding protein
MNEHAQEAASQAKEQAGQAVGQARDQLRTQVDSRSTQAGEQVSAQAGDIRTVAEQLREQGKDKPAQLAEQAADRAEKVGSYLQESDADRILNDVEDFARQRPWAVVAGGIALGFAASRFLKASSSDRYRTGTQSQSLSTAPTSVTGSGVGSNPEAARDQRITRDHNELSSGVPASPAAPATPAVPPTAHPGAPVGGL